MKLLRVLAVCAASLMAAPAFAETAAPAPASEPAEPAAQAEKVVRLLMETSFGPVTMELYPGKAPKSVENFVGYVKRGFYDGTIFHRVIPGFMVQGGGYTEMYQLKPTRPSIECESKNGLKNVRGSVAMARTNYAHSANTQFFINLVDNERLDYPSFDGWGYAVFGRVTSGMDVIDRIAAVPTGPGPRPDLASDVPHNPVLIKSISLSND